MSSAVSAILSRGDESNEFIVSVCAGPLSGTFYLRPYLTHNNALFWNWQKDNRISMSVKAIFLN